LPPNVTVHAISHGVYAISHDNPHVFIIYECVFVQFAGVLGLAQL